MKTEDFADAWDAHRTAVSRLLTSQPDTISERAADLARTTAEMDGLVKRSMIGAGSTDQSGEDGSEAEMRQCLVMIRGTIGDLRKGFATSVSPERWVEQAQAAIDRVLRRDASADGAPERR